MCKRFSEFHRTRLTRTVWPTLCGFSSVHTLVTSHCCRLKVSAASSKHFCFQIVPCVFSALEIFCYVLYKSTFYLLTCCADTVVLAIANTAVKQFVAPSNLRVEPSDTWAAVSWRPAFSTNLLPNHRHHYVLWYTSLSLQYFSLLFLILFWRHLCAAGLCL